MAPSSLFSSKPALSIIAEGLTVKNQTYISDKANASAYVILNKRGEHRATVQFLFPRDGGGQLRCQVWSIPGDGAGLRLTHDKRAGGYGYDKRASALAGAVIDGYSMADHCGYAEESHEKAKTRLMRAYIRAAANSANRETEKAFEAKAKRIGARFANYCETDDTPKSPGADGGIVRGRRYTSLHTDSGLTRLESLGYRVICAV